MKLSYKSIRRTAFAIVCVALAVRLDGLFAQTPPLMPSSNQGMRLSEPVPLELARQIVFRLRDQIQVDSNLLTLGDLVECDSASSAVVQLLASPLAPTPTDGQSQTWNAADIQALLKLRGFDTSRLGWTGSSQCTVTRQSNPIATNVLSSDPSSPETDFVSTNVSRYQSTQAERNVTDALKEYLKVASNSNVQYEMTVELPPAGVVYLQNRRSIIGISGGEAPWIGRQRFNLQTKQREGEVVIEVAADVQLPPMIFVAVRSLARDHVVQESDLQLATIPKSARYTRAQCFESLDGLVGKQLNRALASGQAIERGFVANPRLIDAYDNVEVHVRSAGLLVTTPGKAMQGGGMNDLITVEIMPYRSKVSARIVEAGVVSVVTP